MSDFMYMNMQTNNIYHKSFIYYLFIIIYNRMANVNFDESDDDFGFSRIRNLHQQDDRKFPRKISKIIRQLFHADLNQIMPIILSFDDRDTVNQFYSDLEALEIKPQISGQKQMKDDFLQKLSQRIQKCFQVVFEDKSNKKCQKRLIKVLKNLSQQTIHFRISEQFIQKLWNILQNLSELRECVQIIEIIHKFSTRIKIVSSRKNNSKKKKSEIIQKIKKICQKHLQSHYISTEDSSPQKKHNNQQMNPLTLIYKQRTKSQLDQIVFDMQVFSNLKDYDNNKDNSQQKIRQKIKKRAQNWLQNYEKLDENQKSNIDLLFTDYITFTFLKSTLKQILSCQMSIVNQQIQFTHKISKINPQFFKFQNLKVCLKTKGRNKIQYLDRLGVMVEANKIYFKADQQILQIFCQEIKYKQCYHSQNILYDLHYIIAYFLDHFDKVIVTPDGKQANVFTYLCKIFQIFINYMIMIFRSQNLTQLQNCYREDFIRKLLKFVAQLFQSSAYRSQKLSQSLFGNLFSYIAYYLHLFPQADFALKNYMIQQMLQITLKFNYLPIQWRIIKHARFIIEKWAMDETIDQQTMQKVVQLFLQAFLNPKFIFTKDSYFIFIKDKPPSKRFQQYFSKSFLKKIQSIYESYKNQKYVVQKDQDIRLKYDRYIFTIHLILIGNYRLIHAYQISKILYQMYTQNAHNFPSIYCLRTWICEYYKPDHSQIIKDKIIESAKLVQSLQFMKNSELSALECLQPQFPQRLQNREQIAKNLSKCVTNIKSLINFLELKNQISNLTQQSYHILINDIINFLSDSVGDMYNKILNHMMKSKEDNAQIQKLLIRNFFMLQKSIYRQSHQIIFCLKNIIRLYLCNLTDMINFKQTRYISTQIAKLFKNLHLRDYRQQRTRIQLINQFLANYIFKKRSHLLLKQTIQTSNAYIENKKQTLNRSSFLSLNIVIPIFCVLKQNMPHYIKLLTSYGRQEFQGRFRFNHHIAFENQLRKITQNTDIFEIVIKNTLITHATSLINSIFLPKINNRTEQLQKIGLSLYIIQFQQIFNAEECQDYIQDHVATFIQIYKHKNRTEVSRNRLAERTNFKQDQPSDFQSYGVQPLTYEQFKEKARKILLKFLQKLPDRLFGMNARKFSLRSLLEVIKQYNQGKKQQDSETQFYNQQQFLMVLIEKSRQVLQRYLNNEQQKNQESELKIQNSLDRSVMKKKRTEKKKKHKNIEYSPLCMVFKVLAHVGSDNTNLVKHTFNNSIQLKIMQILNKVTYMCEIDECFVFLSETLPNFYSQLQVNQVEILFKYYLKVINLLGKFANKNIYKCQIFFINIVKNIEILKNTHSKLYNILMKNIINILYQNLLSKRLIKNVTNLIIKIFLNQQDWLLAQIQMQIKAYIYEEYQKQIRQVSMGRIIGKYAGKQNKIAIQVRSFLKDFQHNIILSEQTLRKLTNDIFQNTTSDGHYLLYKKGLQNLFMSQKVSFPKQNTFYNIKQNQISNFVLREIISQILNSQNDEKSAKKQKKELEQKLIAENKDKQEKIQGFGTQLLKKFSLQQQKQKKELSQTQRQLSQLKKSIRKLSAYKKKLIQILENLIKKFKFIIPFIFTQIKLQNHKFQTFLTWVLDRAVQTLDFIYIQMLIVSLNTNHLYMNKNGIKFNVFIGSCIISYLVNQLKQLKQSDNEQKDKQKRIVFVIMCCLSIKDFNALSKLPLQENNSACLKQIIQIKIRQLNSKQQEQREFPLKFLYCQAYFLICKNQLVQKFKRSNNLFENTEPEQDQFINPKIFFHKQMNSFGRKAMYSNFSSSPNQILEKYKDTFQPKFTHAQQIQRIKGNNLQQIRKQGLQSLSNASYTQINLNLQIIQSQIQADFCPIADFYRYFPSKSKKKDTSASFRFDPDQNDDRNFIQTKTLLQYRGLSAYYKKIKLLIQQDKNQGDQDKFLFRYRSDSNDQNDSDSNLQEFQNRRNYVPLRISVQNQSSRSQERGFSHGFNGSSDNMLINPVQFVESLSIPKQQVINTMSPKKQLKQEQQKKQLKQEQQKKQKNCNITNIETEQQQMVENDEMLQKLQNLGMIKKPSQTKQTVQEALMMKIQEATQKQQSQRIDQVLNKFDINQKTLINDYGINKEQLSVKSQEQIAEILAGIIDSREKQQIRDKHLFENQNYKILSEKKNYYDRCSFLIDAPQSFFTQLPLEVRQQIIRQRDTLRRDNYRSNRSKQYQNQIYNNQNQHNRVSFYSMGGRRARRLKDNQTPKIKKYKKLEIMQQIDVNQITIISILSSLLVRVEDNQNIYNMVSLLLELEKQMVNQKVLTSLVIMLKMSDKLELKIYTNQKQSKWRVDKKTGSLSDLEIFRQNLLKIIFSSIQNNRFQYDSLITNRTSFQCYRQIFDESLKFNTISQLFQKDLGADQSTYVPFTQIFDIILEKHIKLAPQIISKAKYIPPKLIGKIFQKTYSGDMHYEFYDKAQILSENQQLGHLFSTIYTEDKPPSFQLLGKIMKFKIGNLPYLKKLHQKALKYYTPAYNDFLREIFRFYDKQQLLNKTEQWIKHRSLHFKLIQELFDQGKPIQNQPIGKLIDIPDLLDFKTKKMIFLRHPKFQIMNHDDFSDQSALQVDIDNKNILKSSYNAIMSFVASEMRKRISVKFIGQSAFGEGMFKVWINQVAKQIFSPSACLFIPLGQQDTYQPNPYSYQNPQHLHYFKFLGRLLGVAILQNQVVPAFFTKIFYKTLLNKPAHYSDLKDVNPDLYQTIKFIHNCEGQGDIQQIGYTFVYKGLDLQGQKIQKQLKKNGKNIVVTESNKQQFIQLATQQVLTDFCSQQYQKIKEGFNDIIPLQSLSIFSVNDLQLLISGIPEISIEQFKKFTKYSQYDQSDQIIQWFWQVVSEASKQQVTNILQFITGTSRLAEGGFSKNPITIKKASTTDQWPRGVTCFNTLQLPEYSSKQMLKDRLTKVMIWSKGGIGLQE